VGAFAGAAAGAVGDGDEGGFEGFEVADVLEEGFGGGVVFGGDEFERESGFVGGEYIGNVHNPSLHPDDRMI